MSIIGRLAFYFPESRLSDYINALGKVPISPTDIDWENHTIRVLEKGGKEALASLEI